MTDEIMTLRTLPEKSSDADLLREMICFTAQRLMELEVEGLTGAAHGERSPERINHRKRLPRPAVGDPRRHGGAAHPQAAERQLLPGIPGTAPPGREGLGGDRPGGL